MHKNIYVKKKHHCKNCKNKRRGFTLIEILAVIIIIAVIFTFAIPEVLNMIEKSNKKAFKSTNEYLLGMVVDECAVNEMHTDELAIEYDINNNEISPKLDYKGKLPTNGKIYVTDTCDISFNTNNDKYCAMKFEGDLNVYVGTYIEGKCQVDGVTKYTLTLNPQGGIVSDSTIEFYHNDKYGILEVPTRSGYTFLGWFTDPIGGDLITESTSVINGSHTVYAHWTPIYTYSYTGNYQTFTAPLTGTYFFETWGAQGGGNGGRGAYASGSLKVNAGTTYYVFVGQNPTTSAGGYNGGGSCGSQAASVLSGKGGGGATDIRTTNGNTSFDQRRRIMVAAGGGSTTAGGYGGALVGGNGITEGSYLCLDGNKYDTFTNGCIFTITTGANQTSGGIGGKASVSSYPYMYNNWVIGEPGNFYQGSNNVSGCTNDFCKWSAGGGGGWYGGGGGANTAIYIMGGGGGSSFVSGCTGCQAIDDSMNNIGNVSVTGLKFDYPVIIPGNGTMPRYSGTGTMNGNTGNGYARITYIP